MSTPTILQIVISIVAVAGLSVGQTVPSPHRNSAQGGHYHVTTPVTPAMSPPVAPPVSPPVARRPPPPLQGTGNVPPHRSHSTISQQMDMWHALSHEIMRMLFNTNNVHSARHDHSASNVHLPSDKRRPPFGRPRRPPQWPRRPPQSVKSVNITSKRPSRHEVNGNRRQSVHPWGITRPWHRGRGVGHPRRDRIPDMGTPSTPRPVTVPPVYPVHFDDFTRFQRRVQAPGKPKIPPNTNPPPGIEHGRRPTHQRAVTRPPISAAQLTNRFTVLIDGLSEVLGESPASDPERQVIEGIIQDYGGTFTGPAAVLNDVVAAAGITINSTPTNTTGAVQPQPTARIIDPSFVLAKELQELLMAPR